VFFVTKQRRHNEPCGSAIVGWDESNTSKKAWIVQDSHGISAHGGDGIINIKYGAVNISEYCVVNGTLAISGQPQKVLGYYGFLPAVLFSMGTP
jgi:uncharacterized Zn ribbon protein